MFSVPYAAAMVMAGSLLVAASAAVSAPVEQTMGGIAIMHGGVGFDDRNTMKQASSRYNLRLTMATKGSGAYLSGTRVLIADRRGTSRVDTIASGPWVFARLPAGDYVVTATEGKQTLRQEISIKGDAAREWVFRFDASSSAR